MTTKCGTFNYLAPEVLLQKKYDGFKADIYSSGICLYILVAGYFPYKHNK